MPEESDEPTMNDAPTPERSTGEPYSGLLGAFRYGFGATDSRLLRSYVVVSALLGLALVVLFGSTLLVWFVETLGRSAATTTSNAFLGVIALFVLGPLFAPVLLVARRHRRGDPSTARQDLLYGLTGYLFVASLYATLLISAPPDVREAPPEAVAPVVEALYSLPRLAALVPPVVAALLITAVHWRARYSRD